MGTKLTLTACTIDLLRQVALHLDGRSIRLSSQEVLLLGYLSAQPGVARSREDLLSDVWGHPRDSLSRAVDKSVNRLRSKIERDPSLPDHLVTVHGQGYRLVLGPSRPTARVLRPLPAATDAFVGRADDLAAIEAALSRSRLVSLVGLGGIGKTRLALEFARSAGGSVAFVDGTRLTEAGELPEATANALALPLAGATAEAHTQGLGDALTQSTALLLLDNMEHLDGAGAFALRLTTAAPALRILATSRIPLRALGETLVEVGPLHPSEAATLYATRLRGRRPPSKVSELVELLQGIPLAVELAAAQSNVLSADELVQELRRGTRLLQDHSAGRPPRHQSLDSAIAGSWQLLSTEEQQHLANLAVFRGGFTRPAAGAVLRLDDRPLRALLARFRDLSLLRTSPAETGIRFDFLQCIREFIHEHQPPSASAVRAHWELFLQFARARLDDLPGPRGPEAVRDLHVEQINLLAAARSARRESPDAAGWITLAIAPMDTPKGHAPDGVLELLGDLREAVADPVLALRLDVRLTRARQFARDPTSLEPELRGLRERARTLGDEPAILNSSLALARTLHRQGDDAGAAASLGEALALLSASSSGRAQLLIDQATFLGRIGDPNAVTLLREGIVMLEQRGEVLVLPRALSLLGSALRRTMRLREARHVCEQSLAARPSWDVRGRAAAHGTLGLLMSHLGRHDESRFHHEEAIRLELSLGRPVYAAQHAANQALKHLSRLEVAEATDLFRRAERYLGGFEEPTVSLSLRRVAALLALLDERYEAALVLCDAALALQNVRSSVVQESLWLCNKAPVLALLGQSDPARAVLDVMREHEAAARFEEVRCYLAFLDEYLQWLDGNRAANLALVHTMMGPTRELSLHESWPEAPILLAALERIDGRESWTGPLGPLRQGQKDWELPG